jgi:DNA-binding MarR family transcriptional regulator
VPPPSTDTRTILDAIRHIVRALRIASRSAEQSVGLSAAQLFVLQKLAEGDGISLGELARLTLTHQSSVSVIVGTLAS